MSTRYASDLTIMELKEELRKLDLAGTSCKSELIARLNRSTPNGTWSELRPEAQVNEDIVEVADEGSSYERPERSQREETIGYDQPHSPEKHWRWSWKR
jgi:hypothetical protein